MIEHIWPRRNRTYRWRWNEVRRREWTHYESYVGWRMWYLDGWWTREYAGKSYTDSWQGSPDAGCLSGDWRPSA